MILIYEEWFVNETRLCREPAPEVNSAALSSGVALQALVLCQKLKSMQLNESIKEIEALDGISGLLGKGVL